MHRYLFSAAAVVLFAGQLSAVSRSQRKVTERLDESATVLTEIMSAPDKGIPRDLLENAHCAVIVPGLKKGAFLIGGQYGKGFVTCRSRAGWSAPAAIRIEGGSVGFQIGGMESDVILLVMNDRGARRLMQSKFTLGGEGEVAGGPVGRSTTARTDAKFTAEILGWSRTRGVFAGVSLSGATLRADVDDNQAMYGRRLSTREIVNGGVRPPSKASRLRSLLARYSPREK